MAGLHEKVALVPRSRMPGAYALGPSEKLLLWVSGTPRSLLSLFYPRGGTRGMLSSFTPAFFCRWSRVESSQMFLSWLPLTASKMWLLLPLPFNHLQLGSEQAPPGPPAKGGRCARGSAPGRCLQAGEPRRKAAGAMTNQHEVFAPEPTPPWPLLHFGSTFYPPGLGRLGARGPDAAAGAGRLPYGLN